MRGPCHFSRRACTQKRLLLVIILLGALYGIGLTAFVVLRGSRNTLPLQIGEPIDVVYLYVNGSDPWLIDNLMQVNTDYKPSQYTDHDELRYSLRSLEKYALGWIRNIYLVVAAPSQIPIWLNTAHPRLKIVYHRDFFPLPEFNLPTFSSRAIEANIYRISGLSDNFLYMNDDFFILSPIFPSDFLEIAPSNSSLLRYRLWLDEAITADAYSHSNSAHRGALFAAARLLEKRYRLSNDEDHPYEFPYFRHSPRVINRKRFAELVKIFANEFMLITNTPVRSSRRAHPLFLYMNYLMLEHPDEVVVVDPRTAAWDARYLSITKGWKNELAVQLMLLGATLAPPKFLCINDNSDPEDRLFDKVEAFLRGWFPKPSQFEKSWA